MVEESAPIPETNAPFPSTYATTYHGKPTLSLSPAVGQPAILLMARAAKSCFIVWSKQIAHALAKDSNFKKTVFSYKDLNYFS